MSDARICDQCGDPVKTDTGESAAWLCIEPAESGMRRTRWDACSRACAHVLLDGPVAAYLDE